MNLETLKSSKTKNLQLVHQKYLAYLLFSKTLCLVRAIIRFLGKSINLYKSYHTLFFSQSLKKVAMRLESFSFDVFMVSGRSKRTKLYSLVESILHRYNSCLAPFLRRHEGKASNNLFKFSQTKWCSWEFRMMNRLYLSSLTEKDHLKIFGNHRHFIISNIPQ